MYDTIIKKIWITEKATQLREKRKYIFVVEQSASKNEIKKAVTALYRVDVEKIETIRRPAKYKRFRKNIRLSPPMKKAIVTLKEGQKIDI